MIAFTWLHLSPRVECRESIAEIEGIRIKLRTDFVAGVKRTMSWVYAGPVDSTKPEIVMVDRYGAPVRMTKGAERQLHASDSFSERLHKKNLKAVEAAMPAILRWAKAELS